MTPISLKTASQMKTKAIKWMLPLAIVAGATACQEVPQPEPQPSDNDVFVLEAQLPGDTQTKTTLNYNDNGGVYEVLWKEGDKISVNGTLSEPVSSTDAGKKNVDFTVNGSLSAPYNVLNPGTTSTNVISLPATQNYVADSFDGAAAASYGVATESNGKYSAKLKNFCGILRFALKGSATLSKIVVNSLGSEKLTGDFTISNFETGAFTGGTSGSLTYSFGTGLTLSGTDTPVYIAIPAQAYASGLEALVYQSDGAFMRLKFWGSGETLAGTDIIEFESKTFAAGRTENLLAINALTAEAGGEPTAAAPGITVATYNVMRLGNSDRENQEAMFEDVSDMQTALGTAIKNTGADVIGFNEIGEDMYSTSRRYSLETIAKNAGVTGYTWKLDFPSSSSGSYHYSNGFAYNVSVLTLEDEDSGRCWLNTNGSYSTSSSSGSSSPDRLIVWAKFTHKLSGKQFYFFVTQLPTNEQTANNLSESKAVNDFAASKVGSLPVILVGDTNSNADHACAEGYAKLKEYWTDAYEYLDANGTLGSFYKTYSGTQSGSGKTYYYDIYTFCKNHPERRLDHIMVHGGCTVQSYKTIRTTYTYGEGDNEAQWAP